MSGNAFCPKYSFEKNFQTNKPNRGVEERPPRTESGTQMDQKLKLELERECTRGNAEFSQLRPLSHSISDENIFQTVRIFS